MDLVTSTLRWQRAAVLVAFVGAVVGVWRAAADPFGLPKATLVALSAVVIVVLGAVRVARTGVLRVPWTPLVAAAGAFGAALVVAVASSDVVATSLVGEYVRLNGALSYVAGLVLLVAVLRTFDADSVGRLAAWGAGLAGLVGAYALAQWVGADPFRWSGSFADEVFATLGNPDLAAATLAILLPLAGWAVLGDRWGQRARVAAGVAGGLAALGVAATGALQGPVAGGVGLAVLAIAWLRGQSAARRRVGHLALTTAAGLGALLVALWASGVGPVVAVLGSRRSLELRTWYWQSALSMFTDEPVTGVGLARYASHYHEHRPVEAALDLPLSVTVDVAHSVPLQFLAEGGLVLLLAHLVLVGVVGWALVGGLRRLEGDRLLLLGGVGGAWAAYQAQSLVSFDMPTTMVLHVVLAAAVVVVTGPPRLVDVRLPWAPDAPARRRGRKPTPLRPADRVALGVGAVVIVLLAVPVTRPLRADMAAQHATSLLRAGRPDDAEEAIIRATRLASWEPTYWFKRAEIASETSGADEVLDALDRMGRADPRWLHGAITAARISEQAGDPTRARQAYERALALEPRAPQLLTEVAGFLAAQGDRDRALELADRAAGLDMRFGLHLPDLAEVYETLDRPEAAARVRERAEAIEQRFGDRR